MTATIAPHVYRVIGPKLESLEREIAEKDQAAQKLLGDLESMRRELEPGSKLLAEIQPFLNGNGNGKHAEAKPNGNGHTKKTGWSSFMESNPRVKVLKKFPVGAQFTVAQFARKFSGQTATPVDHGFIATALRNGVVVRVREWDRANNVAALYERVI